MWHARHSVQPFAYPIRRLRMFILGVPISQLLYELCLLNAYASLMHGRTGTYTTLNLKKSLFSAAVVLITFLSWCSLTTCRYVFPLTLCEVSRQEFACFLPLPPTRAIGFNFHELLLLSLRISFLAYIVGGDGYECSWTVQVGSPFQLKHYRTAVKRLRKKSR